MLRCTTVVRSFTRLRGEDFLSVLGGVAPAPPFPPDSVTTSRFTRDCGVGGNGGSGMWKVHRWALPWCALQPHHLWCWLGVQR